MSPDEKFGHSLSVDTAAGMRMPKMTRSLFRGGAPFPHAIPVAAVAALALDKSLYYHSAALPRLLRVRTELAVASLAFVAYAASIAAGFNLMEYSLGRNGLGIAVRFDAMASACWSGSCYGWR